jgi:hypothetical protein
VFGCFNSHRKVFREPPDRYLATPFYKLFARLLGVAALVLATTAGVLAGFLLRIAALAVRLAAALHRAASFALFAAVATLATGSGESRRGKCGKASGHEKKGRTFHRFSPNKNRCT